MKQFFNLIVKSFLLVSLIFPLGCVDELDGVNSKGERKLVIYGRVTNEPPPYEVNITRSSPYIENLNGIPRVSGARVTLHSGSGESELLQEIEEGVYQTDTFGMQGRAGEEYYITVQLENGKSYHSEPEVIREAPEIDEVSYEFRKVPRYSEAGILTDVDGFQVEASFQDSPGEDYFLLNWERIYKLITQPERKTIQAPWDRRQIIPAPPPCSGWVRDYTVFAIVYRPAFDCTCCECYVTKKGNTFGLVNDRFIEGNTITTDVGFVEINNEFIDRVYVKASLLKLSDRSYDYWFRIKQQLENAGTLFDSPPANIQGNIFADDPDEGQVLGYFMAAGSSTSGVSIDPFDIPFPFYVEYFIPEDCRIPVANSTNVKPDFWE
ncbi:DUF4249 domain-containing protein [Roseivirga sp. BDSF3-8]|uniref:DUF4249 domain-containing protein n=1 Tax=Roseivirga sp. BDSF3-8 TaxID=3241598 RepID=UPI00353225F0